ncbi:MAG: hypothetical protein ACXWCY_26305 [Burkholderiales bacterium]
MTGALGLAAWGTYAAMAIIHLPRVPLHVLIVGAIGTLACFAVVLNFRRWFLYVLAAACIHLALYLTKAIERSAALAAADNSSFVSGFLFYYRAIWRLITHAFQNYGLLDGLGQFFLLIVMPIVSVLLVIIGVETWRRSPGTEKHAF